MLGRLLGGWEINGTYRYSFTDSQGNVIDSHGRLASTLAQDPLPTANLSKTNLDVGTVTQGQK